MKRISFFLATVILLVPAALSAQDAAVEERLDKLAGQIKDLIEAKDAQNKRIEELAKGLRELQDHQNKPNNSYASPDDVKRLTEKLREIDRKRQDDNELIIKKIEALGQSLRTSQHNNSTEVANTRTDNRADARTDTRTDTQTMLATKSEKLEYTVKEGDRGLMSIARAYNDQGVKVTVKQILDANPGLKSESLRIGQKIFIPQP
jgi:uncharacterized coiled-coil DUF342 family protein